MQSAAAMVTKSSIRASTAACAVKSAMGDAAESITGDSVPGSLAEDDSSTSLVQLASRFEAQLTAESEQLERLLRSLKDSRLVEPHAAAALRLYESLQRSCTSELMQAQLADRWCTSAEHRARRKLARERAQQISAAVGSERQASAGADQVDGATPRLSNVPIAAAAAHVQEVGMALAGTGVVRAAPEVGAARRTVGREAAAADAARSQARLAELEQQLSVSRADLHGVQLELQKAQLAASESAASLQLLQHEYTVSEERQRAQEHMLQAQEERSERDSVEIVRLREEIQRMKEEAIEHRTRRAVQLQMTELAKKAAAEAEAAFRAQQSEQPNTGPE